MSRNVRWTLQALNRARKSGDQAEVGRLNSILEAAQARCSHAAPRGSQRLKEDSKNGKYQKNGVLHWCLLCGKTTGYDPPVVEGGEGAGRDDGRNQA